jgi:hypothetical protein
MFLNHSMVAPFYGATQPFPKQVLNNPFAPMEGHSTNNTTIFMGQMCCLIFKDNTFALGKGHSTSQTNMTIS